MKISEKIGSYFKPSAWKNSKAVKASYATIVVPLLSGVTWGVARGLEKLGSLRGRVKVLAKPVELSLEEQTLICINSKYQGDYPATLEAGVVKIRKNLDSEEIFDAPKDHFEGCEFKGDYLEIPLDKYKIKYRSKKFRKKPASRRIVVTNKQGASKIYLYRMKRNGKTI